jgi:hypothetical protein
MIIGNEPDQHSGLFPGPSPSLRRRPRRLKNKRFLDLRVPFGGRDGTAAVFDSRFWNRTGKPVVHAQDGRRLRWTGTE